VRTLTAFLARRLCSTLCSTLCKRLRELRSWSSNLLCRSVLQ
jgi:hypothetical protein